MSETLVTCPECRKSFELTQAMAAPIEAAMRSKFEAEARKRDAELFARERAMLAKQAELDNAKVALEEQVAARVAAERGKLAEAAKAKAREELAGELKAAQDDAADKAKRLAEAKAREAEITKRERALEEAKASAEADMRRALDAERAKIAEQAKRAAAEEAGARLKALEADRDAKAAALKQAQDAELALREERRKLEDEKAALKLEVVRQIDAERERIKADALRTADEAHRLKTAEFEAKLAAVNRQLQEAQRKAEQGSQQSQGEVLEVELESLLKAQFPLDIIEPVPKGVHGGDVVQKVRNDMGQVCGTILWESKRTKTWSDGWLSKLRDDGRAAKADAVGLMSVTMPSDICTFGHRDGVWVTSRDCLIGVATALRSALMQVSEARRAMQGQQGKMELVYHYLAGPQFRQRVEAIVEAFTTMQQDLEAEKKAITKLWAKREKQLERAALSTVGMHGDLAGIIGQQLPDLAGMGLATLGRNESPATRTLPSLTLDSSPTNNGGT